MATVMVDVKTCGKSHKITIIPQAGDFGVFLESNCPKVQIYRTCLSKIAPIDIIDLSESRILHPKIRECASADRLSFSEAMNAGWLETGMVTKTLIKNAKDNMIKFVDEDGEVLA